MIYAVLRGLLVGCRTEGAKTWLRFGVGMGHSIGIGSSWLLPFSVLAAPACWVGGGEVEVDSWWVSVARGEVEGFWEVAACVPEPAGRAGWWACWWWGWDGAALLKTSGAAEIGYLLDCAVVRIASKTMQQVEVAHID